MSWLNMLGNVTASTSLRKKPANAGESFVRIPANNNKELKRRAETKTPRNSESIMSMLDWFFSMVITSDTSSSEFNEEEEPENSVVIPPGHQELLDQYYQDLFRADEFGFITSDEPDSTLNACSELSPDKLFTSKSVFAEADLRGIRIDSPSPNFGFYVEMTPPTSPSKTARMQEKFDFAMPEEESTEVGAEIRERRTLTPRASRGSRECGTSEAGTGREVNEDEETIVRWWDYFIL